MRALRILLFLISCYYSQAQTLNADSTKSMLPQHRQMNKHYRITNNGSIVTNSATPGFVETEISILEDREATALLKRDAITLTALWSRDFTLDESSTGLVNSSNSIPQYYIFNRLVENISVTDTLVYTRGKEIFQLIDTDLQKKDPETRNFIHIWSKKSGTWKLMSRINSKE